MPGLRFFIAKDGFIVFNGRAVNPDLIVYVCISDFKVDGANGPEIQHHVAGTFKASPHEWDLWTSPAIDTIKEAEALLSEITGEIRKAYSQRNSGPRLRSAALKRLYLRSTVALDKAFSRAAAALERLFLRSAAKG